MSQQPATRQTSVATIGGHNYNLIAFYKDAHSTAWDAFYGYECLGNFFKCPAPGISLTLKGITGVFHTSEAAFQATKWWDDDSIRQSFTDAQDGDAAWAAHKAAIASGAFTDDNSQTGYAGLGRLGAMQTILPLKFALPSLKQILLGTGDAYLLEHKWKQGTDNYWSDFHDGTGGNQLGIKLMELRAKIGGAGAPIGSYTVKDFTQQVKPAP